MLESRSPHVVSSKNEAINYIKNYLSVIRTGKYIQFKAGQNKQEIVILSNYDHYNSQQ
jgi:hypothetical protein